MRLGPLPSLDGLAADERRDAGRRRWYTPPPIDVFSAFVCGYDSLAS
jgi:hypothetical protein